MLSVILLMGSEGVGKSTIAEYLVANHGYMELSFAAALRESAIAMWNDISAMIPLLPTCSIEDTFDRSKKEAPIGDLVLAGRPFSPRVLLQWFGTDIMRKYVADDIWVHATINRLRDAVTNGHRKFVFSDYRFSNEYACVKQFLALYNHHCQTVRIVPGNIDADTLAHMRKKALAGHSSTQGWVTLDADVEISNPLQKDSMESWLQETCCQLVSNI